MTLILAPVSFSKSGARRCRGSAICGPVNVRMFTATPSKGPAAHAGPATRVPAAQSTAIRRLRRRFIALPPRSRDVTAGELGRVAEYVYGQSAPHLHGGITPGRRQESGTCAGPGLAHRRGELQPRGSGADATRPPPSPAQAETAPAPP